MAGKLVELKTLNDKVIEFELHDEFAWIETPEGIHRISRVQLIRLFEEIEEFYKLAS